MTNTPKAILAAAAPARIKPSNYPEPFASRMAGRVKRPLGDLFGLKNFGVNLTTLPPGAVSTLHHTHSAQDEFIYVLQGEATLYRGDEVIVIGAGMCAGFAADGPAHHLGNHTSLDVVFLEVGDRADGDHVSYTGDDLKAVLGDDGAWRFAHKDGSPY